MDLIASYTVHADGITSAYYFLAGIEISGREYDAIQVAALDRACAHRATPCVPSAAFIDDRAWADFGDHADALRAGEA